MKRNDGMDKSKELDMLIEAQIESLAAETDEIRLSENFKKCLEIMSRFHKYSLGNQILIWLQNPDATLIAGYQTWKNDFNRYVIKGEKGIRILAPIKRKYTEKSDDGSEGKEKEFLTFRVVHVFDVSQTEGDPIETVNWHDTEKNDAVNNALIRFANEHGIEVETVEGGLRGADGVSSGGRIKVLENSGTRTLVHEIAHELLHWADKDSKLSTKQEEIEADTVAFTVCNYFEIPAGNNPNYLALWDADSKEIKACLGRIRDTIKTIIETVEGILQPNLIEQDAMVMAD